MNYRWVMWAWVVDCALASARSNLCLQPLQRLKGEQARIKEFRAKVEPVLVDGSFEGEDQLYWSFFTPAELKQDYKDKLSKNEL